MLPQLLTLNTLANVLVAKYFLEHNCVCVITEGRSDIDIYIKQHVNIVTYALLDDYVKLHLTAVPCSGYIVQTKSLTKVLEIIEDQIRKDMIYSFYNRQYLFLSNYEENLCGSKHLGMISEFLLIDLTNNHTYDAVTCKYSNQTWIPQLLDQWMVKENIFKLDNLLYSPTLLVGRNINIGAFNYHPYVNLDSMAGIELKLMLEYCKRYKLSLKIINYITWGEFHKNYTGDNILGGLLDDSIHIGLGGFYLSGPKMEYFDHVGATLKVGISCLVPSPKKLVGFKLLPQPFSRSVWIVLIFAFNVFIVTWWFMNKHFKRFRHDYLGHTVITIIGVCLQQPTKVVESSKLWKLRIVAISMLFFTLIISAAYNSKLYSIMTNPQFVDAIETIDDLSASSLRLGMTHISYGDPLTYNVKYANLVKRIFVGNFSAIREWLLSNQFAIIMEHFNRGKVYVEFLQIDDLKYITTMKDDLYWTYSTIMLQRSSVFQPTLYRHVLEMTETGLIIKWTKEAMSVNYTSLRALKETHEKRVNRLNRANVQGIFTLWFGGIGTGIITFILEIVVFYVKY